MRLLRTFRSELHVVAETESERSLDYSRFPPSDDDAEAVDTACAIWLRAGGSRSALKYTHPATLDGGGVPTHVPFSSIHERYAAAPLGSSGSHSVAVQQYALPLMSYSPKPLGFLRPTGFSS